jgi:flagellar hook assembly protein FlgD
VFSLQQNYPNPFNPTTRIEYTLPKAMRAELVVYDLVGRRVKTLVNDDRHAGQHFVQWDGTNEAGRGVASGTYFYKLTAGEFTKVAKMMLVR